MRIGDAVTGAQAVVQLLQSTPGARSGPDPPPTTPRHVTQDTVEISDAGRALAQARVQAQAKAQIDLYITDTE